MGVGASLAMEKAPTKSRGCCQACYRRDTRPGYLLAAVCYFFVFPRGDARPMFSSGGAPALLALFVRFRVQESAVWQRNRPGLEQSRSCITSH